MKKTNIFNSILILVLILTISLTLLTACSNNSINNYNNKDNYNNNSYNKDTNYNNNNINNNNNNKNNNDIDNNKNYNDINNNNSTNKLTVITTIFPLYEFSKEIAGNKADVTLLLPPGNEPHTFEPRPSDIIKISKANLFIYAGAGMEPWAKDILEGIKNPDRVDLSISDFMTLLKFDSVEEETNNENQDHNHDEEYNPHYWLDFSQDTKAVDAITNAFIKQDPANKEYYQNNANDYKQKLISLDNLYKTNLSSCKKNEFITGGHNAYAYLGNRYNIKFVSAYGVSPDSEPTPKTIKEIADLAKENNISYILVEELLSPRMAQAIANDAHAKLLIFNPGGNLLKSEFDSGVTFISLMKENLISLEKALECKN